MNALRTKPGADALAACNLPDEVRRALRVQAARYGRSTEAEVREIVANAVMPQTRVCFGDALSEPGRKLGLPDGDYTALEHAPSLTPAEPRNYG